MASRRPAPRPPRHRVAAAGAVGAAAAGAGLIAYARLVGPRRLVVRDVALELPGWPRDLDGLRVALLSDLHTGAPFVDVPRVVERAQAQRPDLVALAGDFVDHMVSGGHPADPDDVARDLAELRAPLGVFAVLGNHDWVHVGRRMKVALERHGITVLENGAARTERGLWVAGTADATTRRPDVGSTLEDVPVNAPVLVLAHDPDVFPHVPRRVALTLSGHTHAGQVALPGIRRVMIPSRYGTRYARGHVVEDGRHLYVSAGIGTSRYALRLLAPPEIVLLTLLSAVQPPR